MKLLISGPAVIVGSRLINQHPIIGSSVREAEVEFESPITCFGKHVIKGSVVFATDDAMEFPLGTLVRVTIEHATTDTKMHRREVLEEAAP